MIDKAEKIKTVTSFVTELILAAKSNNCLNISVSNFSVFENVDPAIRVVAGLDWEKNLSRG
ncbi:MAG: hypothetical protein D3922_00720 [Candidatus Electrothrix sp. AR1]|nr:hypothetical protein [Candidatus Electrothrix sp. AR1]